MVLSLWEWDQCRATFRLAPTDVPDLIAVLAGGLPDHAGTPQPGAAHGGPDPIPPGPGFPATPDRPAGPLAGPALGPPSEPIPRTFSDAPGGQFPGRSPDQFPGQFPDRVGAFPDQFPDQSGNQAANQAAALAPGQFPGEAPFFTAGGFQTELPPPYPPGNGREPGFGNPGERFPAAAQHGFPDHADRLGPEHAAPTEFWPSPPDLPGSADRFPAEPFPGGHLPGEQFPGEQFPAEPFGNRQPDLPPAYRPDPLTDEPPDQRLSRSGLPMRQAGAAYEAAADGRDGLDLPYPPSHLGPRTGFDLPAGGHPAEPAREPALGHPSEPVPVPTDQWPGQRPPHPEVPTGWPDRPDGYGPGPVPGYGPGHEPGYGPGPEMYGSRSWAAEPDQRSDRWTGGSWGSAPDPAARPGPPPPSTPSAWDKLPVPPRPAPPGLDDGVDPESTQFHPGPDYDSAADYPPVDLADDLVHRPGPAYPAHPQFTPADREPAPREDPYAFGQGYPGRP